MVSTLATLIEFARGNADWMDLGMAVAGFLMMGVGKAFSVGFEGPIHPADPPGDGCVEMESDVTRGSQVLFI
ncbi:hypothetical protein ACFC09_20185 [Streptomyces sp. NPDC056161]|uniref:hypothetical protein n=1 Tax=Streptomyces sp. NPDC056161 TaxID=3345732 RepID=UPI0035DDD941